jgi:xanthine dehydrogenase accessory factor
VDGTTIIDAMPDDAVIAFKPDARSVIVAVSHDPKLDDMALMEALKTSAFYVGAVGSKATSEERRRRLQTLDVSAAEAAKLHGPVGLAIGSRTPPEIAVAIAAELVAARNQIILAATAAAGRAKEHRVA